MNSIKPPILQEDTEDNGENKDSSPLNNLREDTFENNKSDEQKTLIPNLGDDDEKPSIDKIQPNSHYQMENDKPSNISKIKTTANCAELAAKGAEFIFFVGIGEAGKTSMLQSILRAMSSGGKSAFTSIGNNADKEVYEAKEYINSLINPSNKILLTSTKTNTIMELEIELSPHEKQFKTKSYIFLESSGEDQKSILTGNGQTGRLPIRLESYLKCSELKVTFILCLPAVGQISQSAQALRDFLDYVTQNANQKLYDNARFLLVVTKWDTIRPRSMEVEDWLKAIDRPLFEKIVNIWTDKGEKRTSFLPFYVGDIMKTSDTDPGTVLSWNTEGAIKIVEWIYGHPLTYSEWIEWKKMGEEPTIWDKVFKWFNDKFKR